MNDINIIAKIIGIKYKPFLVRKLKEYDLKDLHKVLNKDATFLLNIGNDNRFAVSWWVSAKRTRSYPYERVYNSLGFTGKKITIIPVFKVEGKEGYRVYLQWDTISLMSLLGISVIISNYNDAEKSKNYNNKTTNQEFDL